MTCIGQKSHTAQLILTHCPFPVLSSYFVLLRLRSTLPMIPRPSNARIPAKPSKNSGALSPVVGLSTGAGCGTTGTASSLWVRLDPPGFGVSGTGVGLSDLSL